MLALHQSVSPRTDKPARTTAANARACQNSPSLISNPNPESLTLALSPPCPLASSYDTMGCCSDTPYNLDEDSCCKEGDNYVVHSADAHACDCSKYGCQ